MKIKSKKLIELLGVDDTDKLSKYYSLTITTDVLDDPEALDEFIKLFKNNEKVYSMTFIVKKDSPELSQKLAKAMPVDASLLYITIDCDNVENLDLSSRDFDRIENLSLDGSYSYSYNQTIDRVAFSSNLKDVKIGTLKSISQVEVPDSIKKQVVVEIKKGRDICDVTIPGVENIRLFHIFFSSDTKIGDRVSLLRQKQVIDSFPDAKRIKNRVQSIDIEEGKKIIDELINLLETGTVPCTNEHYKDIIKFIYMIQTFSFFIYDYTCDDQELIDFTRVPKVNKQDFSFDSVKNERIITITIKDATELSTSEAKALESEAKKRGISLLIQMDDEHLRETQMVPYSISEYIQCSSALDDIIETVEKSLPKDAGEEERFAKLQEVIAMRQKYDYKAVSEADTAEALIRKISSRNLKCLLSGEGVCAGFAEIVRNASRRMGFECEYDGRKCVRCRG